VEKQIKEIRERLDRDAKLNADGQGLPAPPDRAGKISK